MWRPPDWPARTAPQAGKSVRFEPVRSALRLIPNLDVWRPCDAAETAAAWLSAVTQRERPSALLLSRQNLPQQPRTPEQALAMQRGGYVLSDRTHPVATVIATGSEVALAVAAQKILDAQGLPVRVVSMPCTSLFERQERSYRASVLPPRGPRIAAEAGVTRFWASFGCRAALGIDSFGESAPAPALFEHFGLTAERLADLVRQTVEEDSVEASPTA